MSGFIFDEKTMLNGNLFKFEQRLLSQTNRFVENGAILLTYYSQHENMTTVDRGLQNIDQLFGRNSPLRFNKIKNFPAYGFGQANPENTDEAQVEDFTVEGDLTILPSTITPKAMDFFMINHLKMNAIFEVTSVTFDSMKPNGYFKIHYKLTSTAENTIYDLNRQTVEVYEMDLNAIGTNLNPVIKEEDFHLRTKLQQLVSYMIQSYIALFYNERHNCFLFHHPTMGLDWFDFCGNEFIAKHSLMNDPGSTKVILLHQKLRDIQLPLYYNNSIYNWLELGAPLKHLQKFPFVLNPASGYPYSSFVEWGDDHVQIIQPITPNQDRLNFHEWSYFDHTQLQSLMDETCIPVSNLFEQLIWKFIHKPSTISIHDVPLDLADTLVNSIKTPETFFYVPISIYIIRMILNMN